MPRAPRFVVLLLVGFVIVCSGVFSACADDASITLSPGRGPLVDDWRDQVIYQIIVDRFDNGDKSNDVIDGIGPDARDLSRHQGGDFAGVLRRLDYLAQLGATTLWLSPIVENVPRTAGGDGYHGYWASDFTRINPRFGTLAELRALVDAAHARDIKVMLDVVINHSGAVFFYDLDGDGELGKIESEPAYKAAGYDSPLVWLTQPPKLWRRAEQGVKAFALGAEDFHLRGRTDDYNSIEQMVMGDFPTGLRDLATDDPGVMDALIDTYVEWVRLTDVDGFRLDAAPHVSHEDWAAFCTGVRAGVAALDKGNFMLLGEVFRADPAELASYTAPGEFDSVFDFTLKNDAVDQFVLEGGSALIAREALEAARAYYPATGQENGIGLSPWQARVAFGDNHDMSRMRGRLDDERAVTLAMALLFTIDAIPAIYYGTEQRLNGQGSHLSREPLWKRGFDQDDSAFQSIALFARLRREHAALRYGDLIVRYAADELARGEDPAPSDDDSIDAGVPDDQADERPDVVADSPDAGLLAYERVYRSDRLLVVLNARPDKASRARMLTGFAPGTRLSDQLGSQLEVEVGENGSVDVEVARRSAVLLGPSP